MITNCPYTKCRRRAAHTGRHQWLSDEDRAQRRALRPRWNSTDQRYALAEGWCVIRTGDDLDEIQRDDDQQTFETDEDARTHVERCAGYGSLLHKRALRFVALSEGSPA